MTTQTRRISPTAAARKILAAIKGLLPSNTRWAIDRWDDGIYHLNVYADIPDRRPVEESARLVLSHLLLEQGLPIALFLNDSSRLKTHPEIETNPLGL